MSERPLGASGLSVRPFVLGGNVFGWTADRAASFAIFDRFADQGGGDGVSAVMQKPWLAASDLVLPRDPDIYEITDHAALSDVYMGYAGAGFGAGLQGSLMGYEAFARSYADAPHKTSKNAFR